MVEMIVVAMVEFVAPLMSNVVLVLNQEGDQYDNYQCPREISEVIIFTFSSTMPWTMRRTTKSIR